MRNAAKRGNKMLRLSPKRGLLSLEKGLVCIMSSFHTSSPSCNKVDFRKGLSSAKNVVVLSGAGISAESGIPTFRGAGGLWRKYSAPDLATPQAFEANPSLVWEFYHYRRDLVLSKKPNAAHFAIAELQDNFKKAGRQVSVITQNIDGFHQQAGAKEVIELHGSLFKTRCLKCLTVEENRENPICPALAGKGAPDPKTPNAYIPVASLPRCHQPGCNSMVRPHVVWFGESLETEVLQKTDDKLRDCDFCLLVGTSSVVYPAAGFAPDLVRRGVPVAEFNMEETQFTDEFGFHFHGPCGETLPPLLAALSLN